MAVSKVTQALKFLHSAGILRNIPDETAIAQDDYCPVKALANRGLVDEQSAIKAIAEHLSIEIIDPSSPEFKAKFKAEEFAKRVDADFCYKNKALPLYEQKGKIVCVFANPFDYEIIKSLEFSLGAPVQPTITEELKIVRILSQVFPQKQVDFNRMSDYDVDNVEILGVRKDEQIIDESQAETPPIVKLANKILSDAVRAGASDIHLEPTASGIEVRFRVDGVLQQNMEVPRRLQPLIISRIKILAGMDIAERRKPQDGRMGVVVDGNKVDMRVSTVPTANGEKIVLRLLRSDGCDLTFGAIGFSQELETKIFRALSQRGKMMLVTGPTGSGKTTTLYTCLMGVKDGTTSIQTVEDPVEFRIPGVTQIQLNPQANVTFASALRSILRQDPDVIMVGEIRDSETADIAMQAAQTGHLVLSTLHTNDAPSTITRLINLGCKPYLIASSVAAILAQRLVRKVCPDCKTKVSEGYIDRNEEIIKQFGIDPGWLYVGVGCERCNFTGYRGRTSVLSFLEIDDEISKLIMAQAPLSEISSLASNSGFRTLNDAAIDLVKAGVTTLDEIKPYIISANNEKLTEARQQVKEISVPESSIVKPTQREVKDLRRERILLVEDDDQVRQILSMLLKREMFDVTEARNGYEALERLFEKLPQLILTDLMMPEMDGREFIARAKAIEGVKNIPIVVLTAVDTEKNEVDMLSLGATDFVSKTSSSGVIAARVRNALRRA